MPAVELAAQFKGKKIAVLMGGTSREREISLKSGQACLTALQAKGYRALPVDAKENLPEVLKALAVEVAFVALHGRRGEDGTVQGLLEVMGIPYTGSGVLSSALALDKVQAKRIMEAEMIPTPDHRLVHYPQGLSSPLADPDFLIPPLMVKPAREGSTLGASRVDKEADLLPAIELAYSHDRTLLVERFIPGQEIAAGIIDGEALPLIEICPGHGHYDYAAKYTAGSTDYLVPARLNEKLASVCQELALKLYQALDCRGQARVDLIVDSGGQPYFLELNTIPGMTETSLLPKAAAAAGISFNDLVERILLGASLKTDI